MSIEIKSVQDQAQVEATETKSIDWAAVSASAAKHSSDVAKVTVGVAAGIGLADLVSNLF